ncbi:MAG: NADP-dependent isocitrate dehydrogenase, partial [Campylobacterales bacterium]|nr:NADP-dependent isocitrate dehydrogenase [Campylobacterales bacterium]
MATIIWSKIDEAPALATYSFFPIASKFCAAGGVELQQSDISLAGRVLAAMGLAQDE